MALITAHWIPKHSSSDMESIQSGISGIFAFAETSTLFRLNGKDQTENSERTQFQRINKQNASFIILV